MFYLFLLKMENFNEIPTPVRNTDPNQMPQSFTSPVQAQVATPVQQTPVENKPLENKPAEKPAKKRNFCGWLSFFLAITGMILIISFVGSPLGILFLALSIIFGIIWLFKSPRKKAFLGIFISAIVLALIGFWGKTLSEISKPTEEFFQRVMLNLTPLKDYQDDKNLSTYIKGDFSAEEMKKIFQNLDVKFYLQEGTKEDLVREIYFRLYDKIDTSINNYLEEAQKKLPQEIKEENTLEEDLLSEENEDNENNTENTEENTDQTDNTEKQEWENPEVAPEKKDSENKDAEDQKQAEEKTEENSEKWTQDSPTESQEDDEDWEEVMKG